MSVLQMLLSTMIDQDKDGLIDMAVWFSACEAHLWDKTTSRSEITSPMLGGEMCALYHSKQSHLSSPERGVTVSALKMEKYLNNALRVR